MVLYGEFLFRQQPFFNEPQAYPRPRQLLHRRFHKQDDDALYLQTYEIQLRFILKMILIYISLVL
jgi:hypothetical protein